MDIIVEQFNHPGVTLNSNKATYEYIDGLV